MCLTFGKIILFLFGAVVLPLNAIAGSSDNNLKNAEWPIDARNFTTLEYYFDPSSSKITVYFWDGNSSIVYSGLTVKSTDPASKTVMFNILSKIGGGDAKSDSRFKQCKNGDFVISFAAPGFDPQKDKLVYQSEPGVTRQVPYKGGVKAAQAREQK